MSGVESLLLESDEEDLGELDLSAITLEEILREEELASKSLEDTDGSTQDEDDLFFTPATFKLNIEPGPGMDVIPAPSISPSVMPKNESQLRTPLQIAEAREKQLLSCVGVELISPLQVKRRLRANARSKALKSRREGHIATKTNQRKMKVTEGTTAATTEKKSRGVVKVEPMEAISRQLRKNIEFKEYGPGSPTVVAIHSKFIAIGTSKGLVIIFDHFQNIRQVLGNINDADGDGPVTAVDVSPGSDYLVCGYQSGRIVLWDMIKGTSLKAVSDVHENPVVSLRFLKDQKPVLVSVDTNGLVNKLNFSKMMGMVYVVDVDPLYDGSAGKIKSISVLPQSAGNAKISYLTDQYCLAALSTETVTFIIAIEPEVRVIYRWARPEDIAPDDPVLPSLAFAWISFPGSSRALAPVLARGWGNRVQFLEVVFPGGKNHSHGRHGFPTFDEHDQIESSSAVMAIQWLGDQVVVYLNSHDEICVYDVMSRQELEIVDVSSLELVFASYRGNNARSFSNSFRGCYNILYLLGLKELQTARVLPWTQRIDLLVDDGEWLEALALALDHYEGLKVAAADRAARDRFPPVFFRDKQNDQCLVDILHMCQTNQRTGEKEDVFRHEESADEVRWVCGEVPYPADIAKKLEETLQKARSGEVTKNFVPISVAERVADLLMEYVRLAIANAPGSIAAAGGELSLNKIGMKLDLTKSHYQMLAGVCIEYCALINRTDLLFGEIYTRFKEANKLSVLVELLEPYILSEKLRNLSPVAMEEFVQHFSAQGKLAQVEQCLLHLNVAELDMDTILKLCHDHQLYSALIYIYNEGIDDFTTPIDVLLEACSNATASTNRPALESSARAFREPSGSRVSSLASAFGGTTRTTSSKVAIAKPAALSAREEAEEKVLGGSRRRRLFGYKLLLYISYAFSGRTFPKNEPIPLGKLGRVRSQICYHLFERTVAGLSSPRAYPRLETLIDLDARELFSIMGRMFDMPSVEFEGEKKDGSDRPTSRYDSARNAEMTKCPSRLSIVLSLAEVIFDPKSPFSSVEHAHFFMFEARLLSGGSIEPQEYADARASAIGDAGSADGASMMDSLMNFLALGPASLLSNGSSAVSAETSQEEGFDKAGREAMLVRLLTKLNKATYNHDALLTSVIREKMNRAAVLLYKDKGDFFEAIASYLADEDHEYQMNAFSYIRLETDKAVDGEEMEIQDGNAESTRRRRKVIEEAVLGHAPALMKTDGYAFVTLILGQFPQLNNKIIQKFLSMGKGGAELEFLYLKQILMASSTTTVSNASDEADVVKELLERSKLRIADDPAVQERFVRLLCEFEPTGVFPYLESHDSYKVDACLRLCKEFSITDAEAYLLERTGDVTGALTLILQSLEQKLKILKPALRGYNVSAVAASSTVASEILLNASSGPSSNSAVVSRHQSSDRIIDSVQEGKDAMKTLEVALTMCQRNSLRNRDEQAEKLWFTLLDKLLRIQNSVKRSLSSKTSSRNVPVSRNHSGSAMTAFQVALNEMIRFILERMASSVSLKSILFKITNEHGRGAFGDFRPTIFGMLDTYNYEQNIYQTANALISVDLFDQITTLKRARSRCYATPSNVCGYCHVALSKPPFGMGQSGAPGTEKWHLHTSMVLVMSGQTFHESCGKAWQQGVDIKTPAARGNPVGKLTRNQSSISNVTGDGVAEDEAGSRLQRKQPSTRRYLARLKTQRRASRRQVSPHIVLESLIREDNGRNKYLKSSRAVFSLRPDPEVAASKVKKRLGTRKPGSLPATPIQKGSI
ncbi:putative vacuolar protein sorting-associated protein 8, central [Plasmopara halstedii]